ncbi:MFS transporter [Nocardia terpenica]|uniref:MFS transporter n=2 Tax=Nocardia terpenica TaxID=455432 RepID=A0A6G9YYW0_9NOCA|nr:MFS transporter [Nocardia terpenica]
MLPGMTTTTRPTRRLPSGVVVLSACVFTVCISEFMISGLLDAMSASFRRPAPVIALLTTVFAVAVMVSAPVTAAFTVRLHPKRTLIAAMSAFAVAHVLSAAIPVFWAVIAFRAVAGVACATQLSVGAVAAVRMVEPSMRARALAVVVGGMTVANVVGVPVSAWAGSLFGWQAAFVLVAVLAVVGCVLLGRTGIEHTPAADEGLRAQLAVEARVLIRPAMLVTFAVVVLFQIAMFATFTYLQPLTTQIGHLGSGVTGGLLALFGVGSMLGVTLGGAAVRHGFLRTMATGLIGTIVTIAALMVLIHQSVIVVGVVVFLFGTAVCVTVPALNGRVFALAGDAPTLASGVNVAMLNLGNALGPAIAGLLITWHPGRYLLAPWCSLAAATLALATVAITAAAERSRRPDQASVSSMEPCAAEDLAA